MTATYEVPFPIPAPVDTRYQHAVLTLRNGGGTFPPLAGRYVVAVGAPYERVVTPDIRSIATALTELSLTHVFHAQPWGQRRSLGTWVNDGKVHVDVVESFDSLNAALEAARDRDQLAIFDSLTGDDIAVSELAEV